MNLYKTSNPKPKKALPETKFEDQPEMNHYNRNSLLQRSIFEDISPTYLNLDLLWCHLKARNYSKADLSKSQLVIMALSQMNFEHFQITIYIFRDFDSKYFGLESRSTL